ncbi:small ribosomal subunit protein uS7m-like [Clavelina lepadiformis]|uniref:Small ribosomal subunit protein uS7 domain-containing protein n=1 Tax=Clavelina lepadiformis TaxID=159417 RepID=A0ABP0FAQ9_CLALP
MAHSLQRLLLVRNIQWTITKQSICVIPALNSSYNKTFVPPNPDPKFYKDDVPAKDDELSQKNIKPAPSDQTYSCFYDHELHRFEKIVLRKGNSVQTRQLIWRTFEEIKCIQLKKYNAADEDEKENIELNPLKIFHQALDNAKPLVDVVSVSKGGASYRVPVSVNPNQQLFFATKSIREELWKGKPKNAAALRLAKELLAAYNNEGGAVKRKLDLHKEAHANRAYANLLHG